MTAEETKKALQDLVGDTYTHEETDISNEDAIVEGFRDGITLLPHQILGRKWMEERETGKKTGGILADDMGLGKTIQTLTRIVEGAPDKASRKAGYTQATLVICPVAVVSQWASEVRKMTSGLTVIEHHGPSRTSDPSVLARAHVVVTSYSIVSSEYAAFSPEAKNESKSKKSNKKSSPDFSDDDSDDSIGKTIRAKKTGKKKDALFHNKWWRIVLDEAHNIKNRTTKAAVACCALDGKFRWCLTGTPMQNSVDELYSLIKFLRIRPLNDWPTFKEQISQPIKNDRPVRAMKRLQVVLRSIMLRRTKTTVLNGKPLLDLPDRLVKNIDCDFDVSERAFYDSVEERVRERVDNLQKQGEAQKAYTSMLVLLLRLRQACNHPSLIAEDYKKDRAAVELKAAKDNDEDADELADLLGGLGLSSATKRCQLCQNVLNSSNTGEGENCKDCDELIAKSKRKSLVAQDSNLPPDSAKTRKIIEILNDIDDRSDAEDKTIIFSQFTSMLDLIEPFLKQEGIHYVRYDGSMNKLKRDEALEKIKSSKRTRVILISFKAGSTGLNLTCCNNVILVDLWWNPALEDQAFDRAHRLGQTKNVHIYKLHVPGTVEERILELQEKKRTLANAALSGEKVKNMRLGMDDLMALFHSRAELDDDDSDDD
ncbi:SNF2 family N-terminal domain-containing protein [Abortiporus biennis]|nr:SNF2 family N-terminal domain-containing protein [Abortiporus biennis]